MGKSLFGLNPIFILQNDLARNRSDIGQSSLGVKETIKYSHSPTIISNIEMDCFVLKKLLWYLIAGTRGGENRARILNTLSERPYNANQLAGVLNLDYKTVKHHLSVLHKNQLVVTEGDKYGEIYFISHTLEHSFGDFLEIWKKIKGEK